MIDEIQPNYASYSIDELEDALRHVDSEAYPQRVQAIKQELQIKRAQHTAAKQANTEHSDNEQFLNARLALSPLAFSLKRQTLGENQNMPTLRRALRGSHELCCFWLLPWCLWCSCIAYYSYRF